MLGSLSGSTREIYVYLAQEAFRRQTPEVQRIMLATAAVARLSLPLAEALVGETSGRPGEILEHLERSHLFIVPLDRERRWYRYHHLFQEFLQRIAVEREPDRLPEVHRSAAVWWERQGEAIEALHHLVEAAEFDRAAALLGRVGLDMVPKGYLETVRRWLGAISEEHRARVLRLDLIRGLTEVTQAPHRLLAPYRTDPHVGPRIAAALGAPSPEVPARVVIRCLGPFQVIRAGRAIGPEDWERAAPRRLLQYLLLQDRPVHREEIVEALWPDHDPRHAANHLRVALSRLRRVLEPERPPPGGPPR